MGAWDSSDDDENADQLVRFNAAVFDISANNISISPRSRFSKQSESEDEFTDTEEEELKPLSLTLPTPPSPQPTSPLRRRALLFALFAMFTMFATWRLVDAMQIQVACSSPKTCIVNSKLASLEPDFFALNSPCLSKLGLSPVERAILFAIYRLEKPFTPMLDWDNSNGNDGNLLAAIFATQCHMQVITTTTSTLLIPLVALRPAQYATCHSEAKFYIQANHNNTLLAIPALLPVVCITAKIQLVIIHTSNAQKQLDQVSFLLDNGHVDKTHFCFVFPTGSAVERPVLDKLTRFARTAVSLRKRQGFMMVVTES